MPEQSMCRLAKLSPRNCNKGSILMIAMWSLSLLIIFALHMASNARNKLSFVQHINYRDSLHYIARSGAEMGISIIAQEDAAKGYDALMDWWSTNPGFFRDVTAGEGAFSVCYDYFDTLKGEYRTIYGVVDEERKININTAGYETLSRLFEIAGELDSSKADDLAAAVLDWRDTDDSPLINGAEDGYYRGLRFSYESKDNVFDVVDEILLVKDMSQAVYQKIKPYITVYGSGCININTAQEKVLVAAGMTEPLAYKTILFRAGADKEEGTYDDNIFLTASSIVSEMSQQMSLTSDEVILLNNLVSAGTFSTTSDNFMIRSIGSLHGRALMMELICVFDRSKLKTGERGVQYWHEEYRSI